MTVFIRYLLMPTSSPQGLAFLHCHRIAHRVGERPLFQYDISDDDLGHRPVQYRDQLVLQQLALGSMHSASARAYSVSSCGVRSVRFRPLTADAARHFSQEMSPPCARSVQGQEVVHSGGCIPRRTALQPIRFRRCVPWQPLSVLLQGESLVDTSTAGFG